MKLPKDEKWGKKVPHLYTWIFVSLWHERVTFFCAFYALRDFHPAYAFLWFFMILYEILWIFYG